METCRKMASTLAVEREDYNLKFEETELRLGLPGGGGGGAEVSKNSGGKRGFSETVNLELNLPTGGRKDGGVNPAEKTKSLAKEKNLLPTNDPTKPSAPKAQVVGWPPVRSYRKNILTVQTGKSSGGSEDGEKVNGSGALVKVSMDGAPYLRKVDLKMYKSYPDLSNALEKMFSSFTMGNCGSHGINGRDFMNEKKLKDILNGAEYVPTYEDKDGDWMLVGDVPWDMFVESCKRLRLMKASEAIGLAPRAMEKCRNRN